MQKSSKRWQSAGIIHVGASYTESEASNLHVSEVFPHPEFQVLDVGRAYPQGWPQRFGVVTTPHVHSTGLVSQPDGSKFPEGIQTMSIITQDKPAQTPTTATPCAPLRTDIDTFHQLAFNALSTASWYLAQGETDKALRRILSAARQLKQAASESRAVQ